MEGHTDKDPHPVLIVLDYPCNGDWAPHWLPVLGLSPELPRSAELRRPQDVLAAWILNRVNPGRAADDHLHAPQG